MAEKEAETKVQPEDVPTEQVLQENKKVNMKTLLHKAEALDLKKLKATADKTADKTSETDDEILEGSDAEIKEELKETSDEKEEVDVEEAKDEEKETEDDEEENKEAKGETEKGSEAEDKKEKGTEAEDKKAEGTEAEDKNEEGTEAEDKKKEGSGVEEDKKEEGTEAEDKKEEGTEAEIKKGEGTEAEVKKGEGTEAEIKKEGGTEAEDKHKEGTGAEVKKEEGAEAEDKKKEPCFRSRSPDDRLEVCQGSKDGRYGTRGRTLESGGFRTQRQRRRVTKKIYVCYDRDACLYAHNKARGCHNLSMLTWDTELAEDAKNWAIHLVENNLFCHQGGVGENLYVMPYSEKCHRVYHAVYKQYNEIDHYDFNNPRKYESDDCKEFSKIGHFSQIVWKETTKIGCCVAFDRDSKRTVIVTRFYPKQGYAFTEQVPRCRPAKIPSRVEDFINYQDVTPTKKKVEGYML